MITDHSSPQNRSDRSSCSHATGRCSMRPLDVSTRVHPTSSRSADARPKLMQVLQEGRCSAAPHTVDPGQHQQRPLRVSLHQVVPERACTGSSTARMLARESHRAIHYGGADDNTTPPPPITSAAPLLTACCPGPQTQQRQQWRAVQPYCMEQRASPASSAHPGIGHRSFPPPVHARASCRASVTAPSRPTSTSPSKLARVPGHR